MLKEVYAGQLVSFYSSDVVMTQGQLVKYSATVNEISVAGVAETIYGIVAQDVIAADVDNFKLDSVTHQARIGDKVGVYIGEGVYKTDQYTGAVTVGAPLYAAALGLLSATVSGNIVAYAETAGTSPAEIRIRTV